jgi:hypothetical protein
MASRRLLLATLASLADQLEKTTQQDRAMHKLVTGIK